MADPKYIEVSANVRYWEDASLNGEEDTNGTIPLRNGDAWEPVIELDTGRVLDWPEGTEASVHYKVCDEGLYWLLDADKKRIAKWKSHYVPNDFLCHGDSGYGDYIIFKIGGNGLISEYRRPQIDGEEWAKLAKE